MANILTTLGLVDDMETLQGALLHDTVEDTNTTFDEIKECFGSNVMEIVRDVKPLQNRVLQV